jgi:pimeloyl-ACP methyl ester carboxylesterase
MPSLPSRALALAATAVGLSCCVPLWAYWVVRLTLRSARLRWRAATGAPEWVAPRPAGGVDDEPSIDGLDLAHFFVDGADGVNLHAVRARPAAATADAAPRTRPLALYLHGFPEFWWSGRHLLAALADDGYDAVAVDMRGYNLSDKPRGVAPYAIDRLVADVLALPAALGHDAVDVLLGHDWGGNVAWHAAAVGGEARIKRLVALAIPHPRGFIRNAGLAQACRSYYMAVFQAPILGEWMMAGDGAVAVGSLFSPPAAAARYAAAFLRPGAATAAINYYRAMLRSQVAPSPAAAAAARAVGRVPQPVLLVYGARDVALGPELVAGTDRWAPRVETHVLPTGHWPHLEDPGTVVRLVRAFLGKER